MNTDLLKLAASLTTLAKTANGSVYDAAFELAHDYVSPNDPEAEERVPEIAYHLTNLIEAIKTAESAAAIADAA